MLPYPNNNILINKTIRNYIPTNHNIDWLKFGSIIFLRHMINKYIQQPEFK